MFGLKELERKERKEFGRISNFLFGWLNERERKGNEGKWKEMSGMISFYIKHSGFHPNLGGKGGKGKKMNPPIIFFLNPKNNPIYCLYSYC